jgi:hypothetical protein
MTNVKDIAVSVESSTLKMVSYIPEQKELRVMFKTGAWYSYKAVPSSVFFDMVFARASVGKAYNSIVKGKYESTKL